MATKQSLYFSIIKGFYKEKKYTKSDIMKFVNSNTISITPEEYKKITGDDYVDPNPTVDNSTTTSKDEVVKGPAEDLVK